MLACHAYRSSKNSTDYLAPLSLLLLDGVVSSRARIFRQQPPNTTTAAIVTPKATTSSQKTSGEKVSLSLSTSELRRNCCARARAHSAVRNAQLLRSAERLRCLSCFEFGKIYFSQVKLLALNPRTNTSKRKPRTQNRLAIAAPFAAPQKPTRTM